MEYGLVKGLKEASSAAVAPNCCWSFGAIAGTYAKTVVLTTKTSFSSRSIEALAVDACPKKPNSRLLARSIHLANAGADPAARDAAC